MEQNRRLTAILFTDIVGSTSMMQRDEHYAITVNKRYVSILKQFVVSHGGEILNDFGDGSLCCFPSVTRALRCALEMQQQFLLEPIVPLRIGLHIGEIIFDDGKVFGDGVNVASRVQSMGIANSILFSSEIYNKIKNQSEFKSVSLGRYHFKNVDEPMEIFALSNDGLVVPKRNQLEGKLKRKNNFKRNLLIATAVALVLVFGGIFYYQFTKSKTFDEKEKSIAILPFEVTGNNEDNLASGLVEDILIHLSKIKEFDKVISNKSSSQFRNTKKDIKEIGEELGVVFLVTGTIQQSGGKIRVSAQLIDSRNGETIWADEFTKQNVEIFDLQTELAMKIVSALKTNITSEEKIELSKKSTDNVEAYRFYRKGRVFWDQRSKESYDSAELYYKKAIDLDPNYALAYSGIADCYTFNQKGLSQPEAIPIARYYAKKALSIDSTLVEARTTIAFIQSHYDYDWNGAITLFKKIMNDNPNYSIAHLYYGNVLLYIGKIDAGLNETKRAISLDPLSAANNYVLGRNYAFGRRYDSAISQLQKNLTLNPNFKYSYVPLGQAYVQKKFYSKAIEAFSNLSKGSFDQGLNGLDFLSYAYASAGDNANAKATFEKVSQQDRLNAPYYTAYVYISLSDYNSALSILEYAYQVHTIALTFIKIDPVFEPIRNEPRFKALVKKMNFD